MPSIPQVQIGNTVYDIKDAQSRETLYIRLKHFTKACGTFYANEDPAQNPVIQPLYNVNGGGADTHLNNWTGMAWIRTPLFRVYEGMKITAVDGIHILYFAENDLASYRDHNVVYSGTTFTLAPRYVSLPCYACIAITITPTDYAEMDEEKIYASLQQTVKYSENAFYEVEPLIDNYNAGEYTRYTSNGLKAVGIDNYIRGAAYPYDGDILYTDHPARNDVQPFAVATNGSSPKNACFLGVMLPRGSATGGKIYLMWSNFNAGYVLDDLVFDHAFQGNLNGSKISISNNILTVTYIYEGEIVSNAAPVSPYYQMFYDRMEHVTGCIVQTGTAPNISYYGRGFKDYDDYYRFVKNLNDDGQIAEHESRISILEEGGGGGGQPIDFDWGKGYDLLDFGQEYLYAWLNALNSGSSFKVLFTGDSTTAYYNGTADGLKEIFQSCMASAGYSNGSYVNRAVSGINASTWVSNYLSGDISEAPTLYVIRHGFNNESGETEEEMAAAFRTAMVSALETIRNSLSVTNCSIILMTPNTSDDDANHRGQSMKKKLDPIVRQLARQYGCGFIDTFRLWYDPGTYADPMYDDPFGDHRSIHPNGLMNRVIISKLFDFAVPIAYRRYTPQSNNG